MLAEIIRFQPEEIFIVVGVTMSLPGHHQEIEPFFGGDQGIGHPDGIPRMNIVVDIPGDQQQLAFEILSQFSILLYLINKF